MPRQVLGNCHACKGSGKGELIYEPTGSEVVATLTDEQRTILLNDLIKGEEIVFSSDGLPVRFVATQYQCFTGY